MTGNDSMISMWKEILVEDTASACDMASIDEIISELFIPYKISPKKFVANLVTLLRGGTKSMKEFYTGVRDIEEGTASIGYFTRPGHIARAFPLWFYAACPDVMVWFCNWQKDRLASNKYDLDAMAVETADLFGVNLEDEEVDTMKVVDDSGKYRPMILSRLVGQYMETLGTQSLETQM